MQLSFDKIVLQTKSVVSLCHFITQVFDIEASVDSFGITTFELGNITVLIEESNFNDTGSNLCMSFSVDSFKSLQDYQMKLQFYYYRENLENTSQLDKINDHYRLSFIDPDQRRWFLRTSSHLSMSPHV